jgi:hypothetical protein
VGDNIGPTSIANALASYLGQDSFEPISIYDDPTYKFVRAMIVSFTDSSVWYDANEIFSDGGQETSIGSGSVIAENYWGMRPRVISSLLQVQVRLVWIACPSCVYWSNWHRTWAL